MKVDEEKLYGFGQVALAVLVVGAACAIAVAATVRGQPIPEIPDWLKMTIGGIIGFFFGAGSATKFRQGVATATNGMLEAAHKIAAGTVAQAAAANGTEDARSSS